MVLLLRRWVLPGDSRQRRPSEIGSLVFPWEIEGHLNAVHSI